MTGTTDPIAIALARKLAELRIDNMSANARRLATTLILDTIGVTLLGATEPVVSVLHQTMAQEMSRGKALAFGVQGRCGVLDATLINGTASHAADYDDMAHAMGGHPSVPVVPVVFALGDSLQSSGREVLEAYIVGFEAECRVGRMVNPHHYERGWHPTATLGVFGAAAAASRLLKLDPERTATALAIATSMASGVKANFGTMVKPLHVGHTARNGLFAAQLAANGFTSNQKAFEHKQGFFAAFDGLDNVHPEAMLDHWGELLEIEQESVGLKQFPCCGSTHPAIRAVFELRRQGLRAEDVASLEIKTNRRRLPHTNNPDPQSPLGAKFSIQYAAARALTDGAVRLRHFEGTAYLEPAIRDLLACTMVAAYAPTASSNPHEEGNEFAADVTVMTHDGRVLTGHAPHLLGRGAGSPMTEAEMWEKYSDCAERLLPASQIAASFDALQNIENCENVTHITGLFEATVQVPTELAKA